MNLITRVADVFERRIAASLQHATPIAVDPHTGVRARQYRSYDAYVRHQSAKLGRKFKTLAEHDRAYEEIVAKRYAAWPLKGASVLCLGARLGGEVRAFARLGALSVGVDLEPGHGNRHVLPGDVHALQFADAVFDYVFTNILDHVLHLERFADEVERVLKPGGRFIVELAQTSIKNYVVNDLSDGRVQAFLALRFRLTSEAPIQNKTDYTSWVGSSLVYRTTVAQKGQIRQ
jgi:SAM-dependent methyltransferase